MRKLLAVATALAFVFGAGTIVAEGKKEPPKQVVFATKQGNVTFDHSKHLAAAKNDCTTCHDKLFPQEKAALGYKDGMHKKAEAVKSSCAACHVAGGAAFETKSNCQKCHVKK